MTCIIFVVANIDNTIDVVLGITLVLMLSIFLKDIIMGPSLLHTLFLTFPRCYYQHKYRQSYRCCYRYIIIVILNASIVAFLLNWYRNRFFIISVIVIHSISIYIHTYRRYRIFYVLPYRVISNLLFIVFTLSV